VLFCFPETTQHTLEEVEAVFAQGHACAAWRVRKDVGRDALEGLGQGGTGGGMGREVVKDIGDVKDTKMEVEVVAEKV